METKKETKTIYQKLLQAQKEMTAIAKDSQNPFFKSNYFDINALLEEVEPTLNSNGLVVLQPLQSNELGNILETMIIDAETGEIITSKIAIPDNPDPQKMGSIITYFRRYTLQSMLALRAEDDDGNKAVVKTDKPFNPEKVLAQMEDQNAPICECGKQMKLSKGGKWYCKHEDGTWGKARTAEKPKSEAVKKFESELDASMYGG